MDFLYKRFKILKDFLTSPIIEIYEYKHDPHSFETEYYQSELGPDEQLVLEGITFSINGLSGICYRNCFFWTLEAFRNEVFHNLKIPQSVKLKQEYLNKLIKELTLFEEQIRENDILYEHVDSTYENEHNLEMTEFVKEGISEEFYRQKMLLRDTIKEFNTFHSESKSGNISVKTNISNRLSWEKNKIDLIELIIALTEFKAIQNNSNTLTQKEAFNTFSEIFNIEIKHTYKQLYEARHRIKEDETPFLLKLQNKLKEYYKKQDEKTP